MRINDRTTLTTRSTLGNFPAGGVIGTAPNTVDIASSFQITQTTAGQTLSLPVPSVPDNGVLVDIINNGTASFIMHGATVAINSHTFFILNNGVWIAQSLPTVTNNDFWRSGAIGTPTLLADGNVDMTKAIWHQGGAYVGSGVPTVVNAEATQILTGSTDILNAIAPTQLLTNAIALPEKVFRMTRLGSNGIVESEVAEFRLGHNSVSTTTSTCRFDLVLSNGALGAAPSQVVQTWLHNGNTGIGVSNPLNNLHIGPSFIANTGGIRLPITSASANQTGGAIGVNNLGDIVKIAGGGASPTLNDQVGTTYTTVAGDSNNVTRLTNAAAITVTLSNLTSGSTSVFIQGGLGAVTFVSGGLTRVNVDNLFSTAGIGSVVSITVATTSAYITGSSA